jgi:uncharacterized protein YlzI (FlbEa/FlbD family)
MNYCLVLASSAVFPIEKILAKIKAYNNEIIAAVEAELKTGLLLINGNKIVLETKNTKKKIVVKRIIFFINRI